MMVPGSNLLKLAATVISQQEFIWHQFSARTTDARGIDIPSYSAPVTLKGSIQAVPRKAYKSNGLDYKKNYITIYCDTPVTGIERDSSGDRIEFNGKFFQALDENDWHPIDGWSGVMFAQVPA